MNKTQFHSFKWALATIINEDISIKASICIQIAVGIPEPKTTTRGKGWTRQLQLREVCCNKAVLHNIFRPFSSSPDSFNLMASTLSLPRGGRRKRPLATDHTGYETLEEILFLLCRRKKVSITILAKPPFARDYLPFSTSGLHSSIIHSDMGRLVLSWFTQ